MPINKDQTFIPNFEKRIDIGSLISAPFIASSKANAAMLAGQTRFLLEYCFKKDEKNNTHAPYMINMVMTRGVMEPGDDDPAVRTIKRVELTFSVPLLCIVPMNSLAINKIALEFDLDITASTARDSQTANNSNNKVVRKKVHLFGNIAGSDNTPADANNPNSRQYKSALSSRLKVNIDAGPLPLPNGVLTLIDLYTKGIQPLETQET